VLCVLWCVVCLNIRRQPQGKKETGLKGLCGWSGMPSDKHDGLLKRIASNAISLLRWLVSQGEDDPDQGKTYVANMQTCIS
jgi:hypothetical protein